MRAAVLREGALLEATLPDPTPGPGQVLARSLACGICGSDLHALRHLDRLAEAAAAQGGGEALDPARDLVLGHEFCAELVDFGPGTERRLRPGTRVCSMPVAGDARGFATVGYSNRYPGGFGELLVLTEALCLPVPEALETGVAALTEPLAVGIHAVAKAGLEGGEVPLVVGCGPVGLAVVAALRLRGVAPVVAADLSPRRRELAAALGAEVVVDPGEESSFAAWQRTAGSARAVVFECVGVPGMIERVMEEAPRDARLVVAGVCMEPDRIRPLTGIAKELELRFVVGYAPEEFAAALAALAEGRVDGAPLLTGRVGLAKVAEAFGALEHPDAHAKVLVEPGRDGAWL